MRDTSGDRLLRVLAAFRDGHVSRGVTRLSIELGMDKSTVHRNLTTLVRHQFLERDGDSSKYRVGQRAWEVGRQYPAHSWVNKLVVPLLAQLVQRTGATGYVGSLDGTDVVYLATVSGSGPFLVQAEVGSRVAAHSTAMGRAILASLEEEERDAVLERVYAEQGVDRMPPPLARAELEEELAATRARGYSVNRGDSRRGVGAIGTPLRNRHGKAIGSMSVAFPLMPEYEDLWVSVPPQLIAIADELSPAIS